ncbi:GNAT family N-acetyltransferase [Actinomycetota bacterium Odt1-20B]
MASLKARPLSREDIPAWLELHRAVEAVDRTGDHVDAVDLTESLDDPKLDLDRDTTTLWDGPSMVAYARIHTPHGAVDAARYGGEAAVHPDWRRRGLGARLVDWLDARARKLHAQDPHLSALPAELLITGKSTNEGLRKLTEHCGFTPCRWWFDMTHPLHTDRPAPRPTPEGTRILPFSTEYSEAARAAHNDAFRDHWDFAEVDTHDWHHHLIASRSFRPAQSRLLIADENEDEGQSQDKGQGQGKGEEVAAFLLASESAADTAAKGKRDCHIDLLGTRRAHRGRGAAPALLADALAGMAAEGYDSASLTVDTVNPSGALGLYEKSGFTVDREFVTYARPL